MMGVKCNSNAIDELFETACFSAWTDMKGPALRWISIRSTRTSRRRFGEIAVLINQEVEVETTPHRKAKGRQATAFVPKAPSNVARIPRVLFDAFQRFSIIFNGFESRVNTSGRLPGRDGGAGCGGGGRPQAGGTWQEGDSFREEEPDSGSTGLRSFSADLFALIFCESQAPEYHGSRPTDSSDVQSEP